MGLPVGPTTENNGLLFVETSALDSTNVELAFETILRGEWLLKPETSWPGNGCRMSESGEILQGCRPVVGGSLWASGDPPPRLDSVGLTPISFSS